MAALIFSTIRFLAAVRRPGGASINTTGMGIPLRSSCILGIAHRARLLIETPDGAETHRSSRRDLGSERRTGPPRTPDASSQMASVSSDRRALESAQHVVEGESD